MAVVPVRLALPDAQFRHMSIGNLNPDSVTIDAVGEKVGFVFHAPRTGTIDAILQFFPTVTTAGNVDFRMETVDASSNPGGTLLGTNSNISTNIASTGAKEAVLTTGVAVTVGDLIAISVEVPTASSFQGALHARLTNMSDAAFPMALSDLAGGGWVRNEGMPLFGVRYSDEPEYVSIPGVLPSANGGAQTWDNLDSPNERGIKIDPMPFTARVMGGWWYGGFVAGGTSEFTLRDSADAVLAQITIDHDQVQSTVAAASQWVFPETPVLTRGSLYRLTMKPLSSTIGVSRAYTDAGVNELKLLDRYAGIIVGDARHNTGGWAPSATGHTWCGLLIDQVHI